MANTTRSRLRYGELPREVEEELSPLHMDKVWELLEEKFCFNVKIWKKEFEVFFQRQPHRVTREEAFAEFGAEFINPVLNLVLKRDPYHTTWTNILKYIVKK